MNLLAVPDWPPGAALDDRIDTICNLNHLDRRSYLSRAGLLDQGHLPAGWGRWLTDGQLVRLARDLDVDPAVVHSGLLDTYTGVCFPPGTLRKHPKDVIRDAWVFLSGTRICPACRTDSGWEPTRHRLPWSFACPRHEVLLLDACPNCNRRFRAGKDNDRSGPSILSVHPTPGHCTNQAPTDHVLPGLASRVCDHPYDNSNPTPTTAATIRAQTLIDDALEGRPPPLVGEAVTSLQFFTHLRSAAAACAPPNEGTQGVARRFLSPPARSDDMAQVCTAALDVLTQPTIASAAHTLLRYVEPHLARYGSTSLALHGRTRPTTLTGQIFDATLALHGRPSTRIRRTLQPTLPFRGVTVEQIDIELASSLFHHFAPVVRNLGRLRRDLAITAIAMDLTRLAGLSSYTECAHHLRIGPSASSQARYVRSRLRGAGLLDDWIEALGVALAAVAHNSRPVR